MGSCGALEEHKYQGSKRLKELEAQSKTPTLLEQLDMFTCDGLACETLNPKP